MAIKAHWIDSSGPEGLISVYAPMDRNERSAFLDDLARFLMQWGCQHIWGFQCSASV